MSFKSLMPSVSLISTVLMTACLGSVAAQLKLANSSKPFPNPTEASGPFDLVHTYPLYIANNVPTTNENINCPWHNIQWTSGGRHTLTGDLPVYTIYYGSGVSDWQKGHVDHFIGNIKNNPAWNVVTQYGAGKPYFAGRYNVACQSWCSNVDHWCFPCNLKQWNENSLLNTFFHQVSGNSIKNFNAIYVLVLGTDITYSFLNTKAFGMVMGSSQLCATHDRSYYDGGSGYPYITLQWPKSPDSGCNFLKTIGFPNNNYQLDNSIGILFHELVETTIPSFKDGCSVEPVDKCSNRVLNAGTQGPNKANIKLGSSSYTITPVWDHWKQMCSMGTNGGGTTPPPAPVTGTCGNGNKGNGICNNGQCCSQWGWCGTTPAHCS